MSSGGGCGRRQAQVQGGLFIQYDTSVLIFCAPRKPIEPEPPPCSSQTVTAWEKGMH